MIDKDKIEARFKEFTKDYNPSIYAPFIHGTTKERANDILKEGLLTRNDCKNEKIKQCNIWSDGLFENKSQDDLTYFATCMEVGGIANRACEQAYEADHPHWWKKEHPSNEPAYKREDVCAYIRIKNPDLHQYEMDEDARHLVRDLKKFYSNVAVDKEGYAEIMEHLEQMPEDLVDLYDLAYLIDGENETHKLIDETPKNIFSIVDWGTVAVKGSIPPENMDTITYREYNSLKDCRTSHHNRIRKNEPRNCLTNPYCYLGRWHTKENIDNFKNYIKDNIEAYKKRLGI